MLYRIVRPMKRRESANPSFRRRIPTDVIGKARGQTLAIPIADQCVSVRLSDRATHVKVSLRTADPSEAKIRQAQVAAYLESAWRSLRAGPQKLTHKQAVALAGELYRIWVGVFEDNPMSPEFWKKAQEENAYAIACYERDPLRIPDRADGKWVGALERRFGGFTDVLLAKRSLVVDAKSREMLLVQTARAMQEASVRLQANAEGDYRPDTNAERFPAWEEPKRATATPALKTAVSISGLIADWWREAQASGHSERTYESYKKTFRLFAEFLGHDDATRVSVEDVRRFKDHRLSTINPRSGRPISPKTVRESDLAALRSVFGWAVENGRLDGNPASGVKVRPGRQVQKRERSFTRSEAAAILTAAASYRFGEREHPKIGDAKRWVPWLCAYSGARVGEILQLRPQDVRCEDGVHVMNLTPEAGSIKEKKAKIVPLHEHVIEAGFLDFVGRCRVDGFLFLKVRQGDDIAGQRQTTLNRVRDFIRTVVTDPDVPPNHGWRHTFKTVGIDVGIEGRVLDAIVGHAPRAVGERYGTITLGAKAAAMRLFPRYQLT